MQPAHHQPKPNHFNWTYVIGLAVALGAGCAASDPDDLYVFTSTSFPTQPEQRPSLANGHVGFDVFGDSVHMAGLFNGAGGLSHRARIPNWANIAVRPLADAANHSATIAYRLNMRAGTFEVQWCVGLGELPAPPGTPPDCAYRIEQRLYAHRRYTRAIVNEVRIVRGTAVGAVRVALQQEAGAPSEDITFRSPVQAAVITIGGGNQSVTSRCGHTNQAEFQATGDRTSVAGGNHHQHNEDGGGDGEDEDAANRGASHRGTHQQQRQSVCVLWNHVPEEITLAADVQVTADRFVMTVAGRRSVAKREIMSVLSMSIQETLDTHVFEWHQFWASFNIQIRGDAELSRVIYASIFSLVSSLPATNSSQPAAPFGGLGPTGLPKGGARLADYEGHVMWDSEIWQLPVVLLMDAAWSAAVLGYRYERLAAARQFAAATGWSGARFPWESGHTGGDVTQPCCPQIARNELHIGADIVFAVRQHFAATGNLDWMRRRGCAMAEAVAQFWASRAQWNESTRFYDVRDVMGPDEDHDGVTNNVYTNVAVGLALHFADFAACLCGGQTVDAALAAAASAAASAPALSTTQFASIATHLKLPYDTHWSYNPQFEGYSRGSRIKQADTVLIGYPLLYAYNCSALTAANLRNNLAYYERAMRPTGPAMTWSMYAILHLQQRPRSAATVAAADAMLRRSYRRYVRGPFAVWNEVSGDAAQAAHNFLTGAGGFLQAILAGYAGLKVRLDGMHIDRPRLPANVSRLSVTGIRYAGSKLRLVIGTRRSRLECIELRAPLTLRFTNGTQLAVRQHRQYTIRTDMTVIIQPSVTAQTNCPLPTDLIGIPKPTGSETQIIITK